ncbi:hypothetical protein [Desulfolutivibrio sulfoxidireducens]|uniref:hypothetical protein n=1 Tax=Desulfolutivibrio sulfoxidireducens TaxID=2773299 RepID=UPI00159EA3B2|nr:hypothetical protein [Desulfolutivibrio sulfoxidireducens]QLA17522.1 hypothetical protein GD605_16255 [Desulfolutivibrio sulfoxidireducens]QLA21107.1 hypothetical protein GD604_15950 [Desulfolutivibrio sulfoxidireducens]
MAATIDEITINYEEDGLLKVKELDKVVLSKGAWTTIIFRFTQWDNKLGDYGPDRYIIRRYKKQNDEYRSQSKFAISSRDQAKKIIAALQTWVDLPE